MTGQAMHVFIDLGSHKLIIVPPSRPNDNNSMVAKISRLPSTKPHSSSQNHIRRVVHSWIWAVGLLLESFWDQNGHGLWVFLSHFPISHASWLLPCLWAVMQKSAAWTVSESMVSGGMEGWDELEILERFEYGRPAASCHVWEDGSYCSSLYLWKYNMVWAPAATDIEPIPWQLQFLTWWGLRIGYPQLLECWATHPLGSSCLSQSAQWHLDPIIMLWVYFGLWASSGFLLGLWTVPRHTYNRPRWFIRCCIGYFSGLGLMG